MEENQNNEELLSQHQFASEVNETSEGLTSPAAISSPEIKEHKTDFSAQPQNSNIKTQTDSMEVHKHPHHVMHKKKWNEYLLEFLMLFLAVFLGFLAENFREHEVEREREKQYMESFIYDLQNDTANLSQGFPLKNERIKAIDSLFLHFEQDPGASIIPGRVFRYIRRSLWDRHYRRNTTTMDQLNAGGLRLIRKQSVADSIASYDLLWQRAEFWKDGYITLQNKGKDIVHKMVDATAFLSTYKRPPDFSLKSWVADTLSVKINPEYLNEFLNFAVDQRVWTSQDKAAYETIERSAERLIALIKKEYDIR